MKDKNHSSDQSVCDMTETYQIDCDNVVKTHLNEIIQFLVFQKMVY